MAFNPIKEIDIYGVFMPPLILWALLAVIAVKIAHRFLRAAKFYRSGLEQQVFDASLFVIFIGLFSFLIT